MRVKRVVVYDVKYKELFEIMMDLGIEPFKNSPHYDEVVRSADIVVFYNVQDANPIVQTFCLEKALTHPEKYLMDFKTAPMPFRNRV